MSPITIAWIIITIAIIGFLFYVFVFSKRKVRSELRSIRDYFNKIKNLPIKARLDRVQAIAFENRNFQKGHDVWKYRYNKEYLKLEKTIKEQISFIETLITKQKTNELLDMISETRIKVEEFEEKSHSLLVEIERFIELETILRNEATFYKKIFRDTIDIFESKRSSTKNSAAHIDELIKKLEDAFETYENFMTKVNFQKATNQIELISKDIMDLLDKINVASQLQLFSKNIIPEYIKEISQKIVIAKTNNEKIDDKKLIATLSLVEKNLEAVEIKSKMKNFVESKELIEKSLSLVNSVDKEIWDESNAKEIFIEMLPVWKQQIKKFYVISNDLNPLIATLKKRVKLSNEENGLILAFKESLETTKQHARLLSSKLNKSLDYQYKILLKDLKTNTKNIIATITLIRKVYDVLTKKESADIRCDREIVSLTMSYSELSSDIQNNKLVKNNIKIKSAMNHLAKNIEKTKKAQSQFPRDVTKVKLMIDTCVDITKKIAQNFYVTQKRYKIAEDQIMWMSKFRFLDNAKDLDSLLNQAEISFNNQNLEEVENILNIASQTKIIKENMEK